MTPASACHRNRKRHGTGIVHHTAKAACTKTARAHAHNGKGVFRLKESRRKFGGIGNEGKGS
jgi:hypothetical protein